MRLSISNVYDLYRVPVSAWPTAAVRSPIGSDFQSFSFASETKRLNCGSPLKIVFNGSRDSKANAVEQIKTIGSRILEALIESETERQYRAAIKFIPNECDESPSGGRLPRVAGLT